MSGMTQQRVVMVNEHASYREEAVDHVPDEQLTAYVADARVRWQTVTVTPEGTD